MLTYFTCLLNLLYFTCFTYFTYLPVSKRFLVPSRSARENSNRATEQRSSLGDWRSAVVARRSLLGISKLIMLTYFTYLPVSKRFLVPSRSAREESNRATEQRSSLGDWRSALVTRRSLLGISKPIMLYSLYSLTRFKTVFGTK